MSETATSDTNDFLNAVQKLLGPSGLTTDHDLMAPWLTDWRGRYTGKALAMASPASPEDVAKLVKLCAAHNVPIVPQGGNSGMSGGATPDASGTALLLSTRRMNAIRSLSAERGEVICEAGVILQTLHETAEAEAMRFPLTLGGKGSATIGGMIATNAGGTQVLRHGMMRDQVLGIEAVMPDGSIVHRLGTLKKDNSGFDITQLLIGSEGTLGIVTAASLRLLPAVQDNFVIWCGLDNLRDARAVLQMCEVALGEALEGFEVLAQHSLDAVLAYLPNARSPLMQQHKWYALIAFAGPSGADLASRAEPILGAALEQGLIEDAVIAANNAQADAFWNLRESISPAERALGPARQHDISVAPADMPEFLDALSAETERAFPGTKAIGFGHLGDGNIHLHVLAPAHLRREANPSEAAVADWQEQDGQNISRFVNDKVSAAGGSISAEHGIGQLKREELARLADPASLAAMRKIKAALDPQNILNPGKLFTPD